MRSTFTMLVGLPRSGKTTWIENNRSESDIVVSNDWIREKIIGNPYSKSINPIVWLISDSVLRVLLGQRKFVIFDGANLTRSVRKVHIDLAREYDATVRIVHIRTPLEVCLKRNESSLKLPNKILIEMDRTFQIPTLEECDALEMVPAL